MILLHVGAFANKEPLGPAVQTRHEVLVCCDGVMVRKLRGPTKKETHKEKRERRKDNREAREKLLTVVLPSLLVLVIVLVALFYWASKKK